MSKTIGTNLKTHLAAEVTSIAYCLKMTRTDGTVYGFTTLDEDLTISSIMYEAASGFLPTAIEQINGLSVDNLDLTAFLEDTKIAKDDILAGLFDYAEMEIFLVNWNDLTMGIMTIAGGWTVGEIKALDNSVIAEVRSKSQHLSQTLLDLISPDCRADLGDSKCGIIIDADDWEASTGYSLGDIVLATSFDGRYYECTTAGTSHTAEPSWDTTPGNTTNDNTVVWTCRNRLVVQGAATTVTSNQEFIDTARTEATDVFRYGVLEWLTGNNAGYKMEIKKFDPGTDTITLFLPMSNDLQIGDTYELDYGCDGALATCKDTFDNVINFRGEPYLPGMDQVFQVA